MNYFYEDGMVSYTTEADTGEKLIRIPYICMCTVRIIRSIM